MYVCVSSTGGLDFVPIIYYISCPIFVFFLSFYFPSSSSLFPTQIAKERKEESGESFMVEFIGNSFSCIAYMKESKKLARTKKIVF